MWQAVGPAAVEDLAELLRFKCDAPWTWVHRVRWDDGPPELLRFLVEKETVLEDQVCNSDRLSFCPQAQRLRHACCEASAERRSSMRLATHASPAMHHQSSEPEHRLRPEAHLCGGACQYAAVHCHIVRTELVHIVCTELMREGTNGSGGMSMSWRGCGGVAASRFWWHVSGGGGANHLLSA
jgi:hypothetical protein